MMPEPSGREGQGSTLGLWIFPPKVEQFAPAKWMGLNEDDPASFWFRGDFCEKLWERYFLGY